MLWFSKSSSKPKKPIILHLSENGLRTDDVALVFPIHISELNAALGVPERKLKKKYNTVVIWDSLGVRAFSKNGRVAEALCLTLEKEDSELESSEVFKGQFFYDGRDLISYHEANKDGTFTFFDGGAHRESVLGGIHVDLNSWDNRLMEITLSAHEGEQVSKIPKDKYEIKSLDEDIIEFSDFGFKLAIIQVLMYRKELIKPKFDLHEFVLWYDKRTINLEEEGYYPIEEVTQYFRDLPIPKRLAPEVTEIYQDGGNEIYLQLIRFAEGYEDYWDIESAADLKYFPNLKEATICYAKQNVVGEFNGKGVKADWL